MAGLKPLGATEVDGRAPGSEVQPRRISVLNASEVDRRLREALHEMQLAERNAVLWFGVVHGRKLFRELGFSSIYQYAGEALGFSRPRTAQFIRLCESLEELPALRESVAAGDVPWTTAREVAKVATPRTEAAWVEVARKESRRRIERRVRMAQTRSRARRRNGGRQLGLADGGRQPGPVDGARRPDLADGGSQPGLADGGRQPGLSDEVRQPGPADESRQPGLEDAADPLPALAFDPTGRRSMAVDAEAQDTDLAFADVPVTLSLRFTPEQYARYEAILEKLRKLGERTAREELVLAGLESVLVESAAAVSGRDGGAISPHIVKPVSQIPAYQIVVQQCGDCGRARVQTSRGAKPVTPAAAEAMRCDARTLRPGERNRATIPPAVRREVMARDGYRCRAPGCGSARFLEVHHVVPREAGGTNQTGNLVSLCSACHRLAHSRPFPGGHDKGAADRGG